MVDHTEIAYAVLKTSACNPYSLANMKDVMDCGNAACKTISIIKQFINNLAILVGLLVSYFILIFICMVELAN